MKILHTADWHLGHRLHEQSQHEEQVLFLEWLEHRIIEDKIDILLVAGDIFDTGSPSSQSLKLYYDFLIKLVKTDCKHIVITGGNHDSPGTINAPKELLNALSIHVIGKATESIADEVFALDVRHERIILAAIPYLRDQDIRRAVEGETFDEITDRYKNALINHYNAALAQCKTLQTKQTPLIAMGHLFAVGGTISDSEQNIYVGSLGHIGANDFPTEFDYIALGHLHRPQMVGDKAHIRYSGSPMILSFSETHHQKKIVILSCDNSKVTTIMETRIPTFRPVLKVTGVFEECIQQLAEIRTNDYQLKPWVEVILDNDQNSTIGYTEIHAEAERFDLEVLKVTLKNQKQTLGIEQLTDNIQHIKELSPQTVFELKCKEQGIIIQDHPEILDAFNEALQIARDN